MKPLQDNFTVVNQSDDQIPILSGTPLHHDVIASHDVLPCEAIPPHLEQRMTRPSRSEIADLDRLELFECFERSTGGDRTQQCDSGIAHLFWSVWIVENANPTRLRSSSRNRTFRFELRKVLVDRDFRTAEVARDLAELRSNRMLVSIVTDEAKDIKLSPGELHTKRKSKHRAGRNP